ANYGIGQSCSLLIILESIFVAGHPVETQSVERLQIRIHFDERLRVDEIVDPLLCRNREVVIAPRTNTQILVELDFRNDFVAAGTFLEQALRNIALLSWRRL